MSTKKVQNRVRNRGMRGIQKAHLNNKHVEHSCGLWVFCIVKYTNWIDGERGQVFYSCFRQHDTQNQFPVAKTGEKRKERRNTRCYDESLKNWGKVGSISYFFPYHPSILAEFCWLLSLQGLLEVWAIPIFFLILWLLLSQQSFTIPNSDGTAEPEIVRGFMWKNKWQLQT